MKRAAFLKTSLIGTGMMLGMPLMARGKEDLKSGNMDPKILKNGEGEKRNVIGDHMTFKLTGEDTDGQFTLIEELNEPGTGIPMHVHDHEDEIFHVLEGELEMTVGDKTIILKAGDMGFGPRGIPHSWKVVGTQKARVMLSVFPAGIEVMFRELSEFPPGPPDMAKLSEVCGRYGVRFL